MKRTRQFSTGLAAVLAALGLMACGAAKAEEEPSVTPYRPTVSNPAVLSAPGWLEVEAGINRQTPGDGSKQSTLPYVLKYAFSPDFGILLGGDARVAQTDADSNSLRGMGDTLLLLKHRWGLGEGDDAPAFGLEWGVKSPTAKTGLGSGKADYTANGIYSTSFSGNTLDLNLNATRLGVIDTGISRTQWGWAATVSRSLNDQWSIAGELSGIARRGTAAENQVLFAVGYAVSKRVVLDAGIAVGISRAAADRSVFFGVSFLMEKLR